MLTEELTAVNHDIPIELRERLERARNKWAALSRKDSGATVWSVHDAHQEYLRQSRECCKAFAFSRGWIAAHTSFSLLQLLQGRHARNVFSDFHGDSQRVQLIDHPDYFRWPKRPYRPAAIVTHTYEPESKTLPEAREMGLACEILPWSWYFPGGTLALVLTPL